MSGKYFSKSKETPSSKLSYDLAIRRRLWQVSEEFIRQTELSSSGKPDSSSPLKNASS